MNDKISISAEVSLPSFETLAMFSDVVRDSSWIRVLFHGLLLGCIDKNGHLEVGAYKKDGHSIAISLYERGNPQVKVKRILSDRDDYKNIRLSVDDVSPPSVQKYLVPGADIHQNRNTIEYQAQTYRHDFEWLIDFERIYSPNGRPVKPVKKKNPDLLYPRFHLNSGLLYTLVRSLPLEIKKGDEFISFGRTAQVFAANIYGAPFLSNGTLKIDDEVHTLSNLMQYDIVFSNDCVCDAPIQKRQKVDISELSGAFMVQQPIELVCGINSDVNTEEGRKEYKWWQDEKDGVDFGVQLKDTYDPEVSKNQTWVTRVDPCGEAFLSYSRGLDDQPVN